MSAGLKALVIGGGMGGLSAAIGLRRAGLEVEVFERTPELREIGAGLSLWPNAVKALDRLGIAAEVRSRAVPEVAGAIRTSNGAILFATSARDLERAFGEVTVMVHRAELQTVLVHALGASSIRLGATCTSFEQDASGVTARFADGSTARGDLLVGADGLHSVVRAQLHGNLKPAYAGYTAWRAVVPFAPERLTPGESWGRGARFGQVPMNRGRVYWFAVQNAPEGARGSGGEKAELGRIFRGWHEPIPDLIEAADEALILRNDIYDRPPLDWWGQGCVTLLGDAAHPMTPNLGQGACQALEDAVVLADCLREAGDTGAALRTYEARRIPRTTFLVNRSRDIGRVAQWQNPLAVWARDLAFRLLLSRLQARQLQRIIGDGM